MSNEIQPYEQGFSSEVVEQLNAPLDVANIKFRQGGQGRQLKYIKGDTAIDAANRIFGFGRWGYKVLSRGHEAIQDEKKGTIEFYTADVELYVVGAAFPFPGDGVGIVTAPYTVEMHEKARKEAATDALKRALRHYGDQFGLSLYSEDDYVDAGNGELIKVSEVKPNQGKAPAPKRVIDSKPAPKSLPPASNIVESKPAPAQLPPASKVVESQPAQPQASDASDRQKELITRYCESLNYPLPINFDAILEDEAARLINKYHREYKQREGQQQAS